MAASELHVALAGNPNCGKTTLFNLITGQNGYVGNWPGVTVEKKEARLSSDKSVIVTDLPGIYSLSPYSPEERVSRDYLMSGEPDVVIQLIDATNLERNLYLALQVIETGLPVVVALNMADLVEKNGDKIDTRALSRRLGCPVLMVSALKNKGIDELFSEVKRAAGKKGKVAEHKFDSAIEEVLDKIEALLPGSVPAEKRRYWAVKLFERDADAQRLVNLTKDASAAVERLIAQCEQDCDDDAESIITGERYAVIAHIMDECVKKAPARMSTSEKIDRIVTNRILGLPIFILIMWAVYSIATGADAFGTAGTDWVNDNLFGEGFELFGMAFPSIPGAIEGWLVSIGASDLVQSLILDGVVAGVGAVLGFIPQMFVLFVLLSFLEDCGYMARVAFVMDRVFRRFGLSGKSFIPMLVATGCGVPGVLATKTIENEKDRRMTVMTTTFIPCGAKLPIIALLMGALVGDAEASWISPLFYFLGVLAVIVSGVMLKKTRPSRSSSRRPWWCGSSPTSACSRAPSASFPPWRAFRRSSPTTLCSPCSVAPSPSSSTRLALTPGRRRLCPSRASLPRRTSSRRRARCSTSPTAPRPTRTSGLRLPACSPRWAPSRPLARSTCSAPRASRPWARSAPR